MYWNNDTEPPAIEHTISGVSVFERSILKKRNLRPFHLDCRVSKRRVCYCLIFKDGITKENMRVQSMMIASDLMNYYDGYELDQQERFRRKLNIEQERLLCIVKADYADTFEKFLDYIDEDQH